MNGELNVLNVGAGDITVVFNQHDAGERAKAIQMLQDMQARGYALLMLLDDGSYTRVVDIDPKRGRYIVQLPEADIALAGEDATLETCNIILQVASDTECADYICSRPRGHKGLHKTAAGREFKGKRGGRRQGTRGPQRRARVSAPIDKRKVTGVARSAGG